MCRVISGVKWGCIGLLCPKAKCCISVTLGVLVLGCMKVFPVIPCGLFTGLNAQDSRTCCSFMAEACACQTELVRLFPDVCSLLSTPPFPSFFHLPPACTSLQTFSQRPSFHILCVISNVSNHVCHTYDMDNNRFVCPLLRQVIPHYGCLCSVSSSL